MFPALCKQLGKNGSVAISSLTNTVTDYLEIDVIIWIPAPNSCETQKMQSHNCQEQGKDLLHLFKQSETTGSQAQQELRKKCFPATLQIAEKKWFHSYF